MGNKHTFSFRQLSEEHIHAFTLFVRASKINDSLSVIMLKQILDNNVINCKKELSNRIPGAKLIIGNRFAKSLEAEILLLTNMTAAIQELKSCHQTIIYFLAARFGKKDQWIQLWKNQLDSMVRYVTYDTDENQQLCLQAAIALGESFDLA